MGRGEKRCVDAVVLFATAWSQENPNFMGKKQVHFQRKPKLLRAAFLSGGNENNADQILGGIVKFVKLQQT